MTEQPPAASRASSPPAGVGARPAVAVEVVTKRFGNVVAVLKQLGAPGVTTRWGYRVLP